MAICFTCGADRPPADPCSCPESYYYLRHEFVAGDARPGHVHDRRQVAVMASALDRHLETLHRQGCWIEAWYPLSNGLFECRIDSGVTVEWGVDRDALTALEVAMQKAGLPTDPAPDPAVPA